MTAELDRLRERYLVKRLDGSSEPGQKHEKCRYFVLDIDHDPHAMSALAAYADSCKADYPELAKDIRTIPGVLEKDTFYNKLKWELEILDHQSKSWGYLDY